MMSELPEVFVHPRAMVETDQIGAGTLIWANAHILRGAVLGTRCTVGDSTFIEGGVIIGNDVTVKTHCIIGSGVTIDDGAFIGPGVIFTNDVSPRSPRLAWASDWYQQDFSVATTHVGYAASLGAGVVVMPGVTIGPFAMIGAGAIVPRSVVAHALVVGKSGAVIGYACVCGQKRGALEEFGSFSHSIAGALRCDRCHSFPIRFDS